MRVMHCEVSDFSRLRAVSGNLAAWKQQSKKRLLRKSPESNQSPVSPRGLVRRKKSAAIKKKYAAPSVFVLFGFQAVAIIVDFRNAILCLSLASLCRIFFGESVGRRCSWTDGEILRLRPRHCDGSRQGQICVWLSEHRFSDAHLNAIGAEFMRYILSRDEQLTRPEAGCTYIEGIFRAII